MSPQIQRLPFRYFLLCPGRPSRGILFPAEESRHDHSFNKDGGICSENGG